MRFLLSLLPLTLLLGSALPLLSAQCILSGQKAYPTPTVGASGGCQTAATLGQNNGGAVPALQGSPNPFPLFQPGTQWSFAVWVNPSAQAGAMFVLAEQTIANAFDCNSQMLSLQIVSPTGGSAFAGMPRIGQCNNDGITFNGTVNYGVWNHLVYQYDGVSVFEVYLNGVSLPVADGSPSTFDPKARASQIASVYFNAPENNSGTTVFGQLSTLRLYAKPLGQCDVLSDLAGLRQVNLVAEYASQYFQLAPGQVELTDAVADTTFFTCNAGTSGTNCNV